MTGPDNELELVLHKMLNATNQNERELASRVLVKVLRYALAIATGIISTMPENSHTHPDEIFAGLLEQGRKQLFDA